MIKKTIIGLAVFMMLMVATPKRSKAEDAFSSKLLYYLEDNDRIKVVAPTAMLQSESSDGWIIKVDGIYNSISGATPTGAPMPSSVPRAASKSSPPPSTSGSDDIDNDDDGEEEDDDENESDDNAFIKRKHSLPASKYSVMSAATPPPTPPPTTPSGGGSSTPSSGGGSSSGGTGTSASTGKSSEVPTAEFSDERIGMSFGLSKKVGRHTPGGTLSYSTETDYKSLGVSLQDVVDFNKKNTSFLYGGAYTFDVISPVNGVPEDNKRTVDGIAGITQVLSPSTLLTLNLSLGQVNGYLSDPYKVVELNGSLVPENRPDSKNKQIAYVALNQFFNPLQGSAELSFRHYQDSFDITAETITMAWYQKISRFFILSPMIRYYDQTEADFYAVRFSGSPEFYSSDYRVSAFQALGYGLKLIWSPSSRISWDIGFEQYDQEGTDGITPQAIYPSATAITAGVRVAL